MMILAAEISNKREQIISIARSYGVHNVRVFGSCAAGRERPDSDIDLLVTLEAGRSLLDLVALTQDLEEMLGRRVDIVTDGWLSPYLEKYICENAVPL